MFKKLTNYFLCKKKVFENGEFEDVFFQKGYVIIDLLSAEEVEKCKQLFNKFDLEVGKEKYNTLEINHELHRKSISESLQEIIAQPITSKLNNYKIFGYNFAVKKANSKVRFNAHIDDEHADESIYECINVWIPLTDVDSKNGALYMVEGSHKLDLPPRGIGLPFAFQNSQNYIEQNATPMPLKAGQAIFFSPRIIHGSGYNLTDQDRPAIIVGLTPKEAPLYVLMNHNQIGPEYYEKFEINQDFFHKVVIGKRPNFAKSLGVFRYEKKEYDENIIKSLVR